MFEKARVAVEAADLSGPNGPIKTTISIGACASMTDELTSMMKLADDRLYVAKQGGRNRVVSA
ncbi:response regulator PleD [compost metagenome]